MIEPGVLLDKKYIVERALGSGGYGHVYLARDNALKHRQVAIKVVTNPDVEERDALIWEMQALSRLNNPGIVTFYHHFSQDGRLFLVMEYMPGGSLDERIYEPNGLTEEQVFGWADKLCHILAFVHDHDIVHHDIKPSNILFTDYDEIRLGDFGIANQNLGTLGYMPPEMFLGAVSRSDPRVDIYSLGITLLESLTANHPFSGLSRNEGIQRRIAHDFVEDGLSQWAQDIILKATHPTPELRFQSAREFSEAISAKHVPYIFDGKSVRAHGLVEKAEVAVKRKRWRRAELLYEHALQLDSHCVSALLTAGRCQLLLRHTERAREFFERAGRLNPRTQVQKELGWLSLERGRYSQAISQLTDHLQRNASDFEAYNLLLKCYYLTGRYEAGEALAQMVVEEKPGNDCFRANLILCRLLGGTFPQSDTFGVDGGSAWNPFIEFNLQVFSEKPAAWSDSRGPDLKSKLIFQEYSFGWAEAEKRKNTIAVSVPGADRLDVGWPIVTIGSLVANHFVLDEPSVSRRHCAIVNYLDEVWIHDLRSTHGTRVGGDPVKGARFLDGVHEVSVGKAGIQVAAKAGLLV